MQFLEQDTESVRRHVAAMARGRREIAQVIDEVTPQVMADSHWHGADADRLRSSWQTSVMSSVRRALAELDARSEALERHAEEQDRASAPGGVGSSSGGADPASTGVGSAGGPDPFAGGAAANIVSEDPDGDDGLGNGNVDRGTSPSGTVTKHTLTQEDADRIYREYQVEDDTMTTWQLSGFERWLAERAGMEIPDPIDATTTEAELLDDLGPFDLKAFNDGKEHAVEETAARYGDANGNDPHPGEAAFNDDHADAFRHAYLNALHTRDIGGDWTTDFWTGHERITHNDPARESMDLHNNEVGRRIAEENPFATDGELADLVEQAVADGEMVVIDQDGRLVPSNVITPDQAGHPDPDAAPMPGHPQERQTS